MIFGTIAAKPIKLTVNELALRLQITPFIMIRKILLLTLISLVATIGYSQDDDNWWKRMFKKETVEEIESEGQITKEESTAVVDSLTIELPVADSIPAMVVERRPGNISIAGPSALDSLNRAATRNPIPLNGFRIQIYFGSLEGAKKLRGKMMMEDSGRSCYLVSKAPNFAVRVGNYRTELEAQKTLHEFKERFPQAHIVKDKIDLPELDQH